MQKKNNNRILLKELFKNFCTKWFWSVYIETRSQFIDKKHFQTPGSQICFYTSLKC